MAVPFSNTRLRVPCGFAALLESLAREVLRDQPEDIPAYAALHFDGLLKEREESGMDYAEWTAKLEDRFYNNHAFKAGRTSPKVSPVKEAATEKTTTSEEMSSACQTEDDTSYPTTSKPSVSEHVQRSGDKEEEDDVTEKDVVSTEMERSDNRLTDTDVSADEMSGTEEEKGQTITVSDQVDGQADESDSRSAGDNEMCHSKLEATESSSFSGSANVEVEERATTDDEQGQKKDISVESEEMGDSVKDKQSGELESTEEEVSYSGLADVDVCAAELGISEDEREEIFQKRKTHVESQEMRSSMEKSADESADEEVLRHAQELLGNAEKTLSGIVATDDPSNVHSSEQETSMEKMDKISEHSSLSQTEPLETNLQEMEDLAEESLVEEDTKPGSGETQEVSPIDGDPFEGVPETDTEDEPKEEGFVEISFEDVPEIQEKQTDEESVSEASQTQLLDVPLTQETSEEPPEEEAHDTQDQKEAITEMDTEKKEVTVEAEETTDQHERVDTALEKTDQSDSDSDRSEKKADVIDIIPSCQFTAETEEEDKVVDESLDNQVDNEIADEIKKEHNEDLNMEETKQETHDPQMKDPNETDVVEEEDIQDTSTQSVGERAEKLTNEGGDDSTELNLLQTAPSNLSEPEGEKESETLEANTETLPAHGEERETTPVKLQPPDGVEETDERPHEQQASEKLGKVAEGTIDSEGRGKDDSVDEKEGKDAEEAEEAEEEEEGRIIPTQRAEQADDDSPDNHRPEGSGKDTVIDPQCISNDKEECSRPQEEEDIMDIPLDDPEANKAAAKIQAGFRGHMTRKKIKPENKAEVEEVSSTGEALNCSLGDAETGGSGTVERDDTTVPEQ